MYDDDPTHNFLLTAAAGGGALGLSTWLPLSILAVLVMLAMITIALRLGARRNNK